MREKNFLSNYPEILDKLRNEGYIFEIIFLETSTEVLLRRYSQTRRKHPLSEGKNIYQGIQKERDELKGLREISDLVINTSNFNVHELKKIIIDHVEKTTPGQKMKVYILSFGFKYGIPNDADIVVDVRFLPNPYFVKRLKNLDGTSSQVKKYIEKWPETHKFLSKYLDLLKYIMPLYEREGKSSLTLAVGCTAGIHRSVCIACIIYRELERLKYSASLSHRDIELER